MFLWSQDQDYLHLSEEEDEAEDDRDKRRTGVLPVPAGSDVTDGHGEPHLRFASRVSADRNSSGALDSEQKRVRTKLRRFLQRRPTLQSVKEKGYIRGKLSYR